MHKNFLTLQNQFENWTSSALHIPQHLRLRYISTYVIIQKIAMRMYKILESDIFVDPKAVYWRREVQDDLSLRSVHRLSSFNRKVMLMPALATIFRVQPKTF